MVQWLLTLACSSLVLEAGKGGRYKVLPNLNSSKEGTLSKRIYR